MTIFNIWSDTSWMIYNRWVFIHLVDLKGGGGGGRYYMKGTYLIGICQSRSLGGDFFLFFKQTLLYEIDKKIASYQFAKLYCGQMAFACNEEYLVNWLGKAVLQYYHINYTCLGSNVVFSHVYKLYIKPGKWFLIFIRNCHLKSTLFYLNLWTTSIVMK